MENEPKPILPEPLSQSESALMVKICQYHAQVLYAVRNALDFDKRYTEVMLPLDGVVPAGTVLLDGCCGDYEGASGALIDCGFAIRPEVLSEVCELLTSSAQLELRNEPDCPRVSFCHLEWAFLAIFKVYRLNERLGHPATLKQIFELLLAADFTEWRYGYLEWSKKALDLAYPNRVNDWPIPRDEKLWNTDMFDIYLDEAKEQWPCS